MEYKEDDIKRIRSIAGLVRPIYKAYSKKQKNFPMKSFSARVYIAAREPTLEKFVEKLMRISVFAEIDTVLLSVLSEDRETMRCMRDASFLVCSFILEGESG